MYVAKKGVHEALEASMEMTFFKSPAKKFGV
jgi:hypothetical protein